jgi:hypothetical protein
VAARCTHTRGHVLELDVDKAGLSEKLKVPVLRGDGHRAPHLFLQRLLRVLVHFPCTVSCACRVVCQVENDAASVESGSTSFIVVLEIERAARFKQSEAAGEHVGLGLDVQDREDGHHTVEALVPRRVLRQAFVPHLFAHVTVMQSTSRTHTHVR